MRVPDFQRSFLTFTSDDDRKESQTRSHAAPYRFNAARIQLESVCTLTGAGGATHRYVLGASCKSEIVGLDSDLWLHPNADYCPVASDSEDPDHEELDHQPDPGDAWSRRRSGASRSVRSA